MPAFKVHAGGTTRLATFATDVAIGRGADCSLVLDDDRLVSRLHTIVELRNGDWSIRDCGSRNGTRLNGARLVDSVPLRDGDEVRIGAATLVFVADSADPDATIAERDDPAQGRSALTAREREVLACVAGGLTDKDIARRLDLTLATVRSHLDRIRDKTDRRRRAELTRLAHDLSIDPVT